MNHPPDQCCSSCLYWVPVVRPAGECRAIPPMPAVATQRITIPLLVVWPSTLAADWCGRFHAMPVRQTYGTQPKEVIGNG